jgi:diguanylate cyclase (GGDEF)-like protein
LLASVEGSSQQHLAWMWVDAPRLPVPKGEAQVLQMALDLAALALKAHCAEQHIRRLAQCDELTGLANRAAIIQSLERALARARRDESLVGILLIDLDSFQQVNQRFGQQAGDLVLRELAGRLQQAVRKGDVLARWAGDGFMVLMERVKGEAALSRVASKLQKAIAEPLAQAPGLQLAASIGICAWPQDGVDADALLRRAELAMLAAREQGGACHARGCIAPDEPAPPPGDASAPQLKQPVP